MTCFEYVKNKSYVVSADQSLRNSLINDGFYLLNDKLLRWLSILFYKKAGFMSECALYLHFYQFFELNDAVTRNY